MTSKDLKTRTNETFLNDFNTLCIEGGKEKKNVAGEEHTKQNTRYKREPK